MVLFIEKRWLKTKWMFLLSMLLYILFLILFSTFLDMMYFRESVKTSVPLGRATPMCAEGKSGLSRTALPGGSTSSENSAVDFYQMMMNKRSVESRVMKRQKESMKFFSSCVAGSRFSDPPLCSVEIFLVISLRFQ